MQNLNFKGWNSQVHREFPRKFESSNLSRDNLSREIGRRLAVASRSRAPRTYWSRPCLRGRRLPPPARPRAQFTEREPKPSVNPGSGDSGTSPLSRGTGGSY